MGRWFGAGWIFPALVGLAVGVAVPAAAQGPEGRPGQPGWVLTDGGCQVWTGTAPVPAGGTASWSGACVNGRVSGPGTLVWGFDGIRGRYEGGMRDGKPHGGGSNVWATGDRYDGEYRDGEAHGRGVMVAANGDRYDGAWHGSKPHGSGTQVWASGDRYDGAYREGKEHGRGIFVGAGGDRYDGAWRDGKFHGNGSMVWANGDRYDGEWRDGVADGIGVHFDADSGETHNGLWQNGCFDDGVRRAAIGVDADECP